MSKILPSGNCPNCDQPLVPDHRFCPNCGQKRFDPHDFSFRHFVVHSVVDYFHADGGFFNTLKLLVSKPGFLTREYLEGKRIRQMHPFKLLMFITIVYFLLFSAFVLSHNSWEAKPAAVPDKGNDLILTLPGNTELSMDSAKKIIERTGLDSFVDSVAQGESWLVRTIAKKIIILVYDGQEALKEKLVHKASKVVFLLIPVLALLMKLVYIRQKRLYYDHLIFSLHVHAFLFLMLILYIFLSFIPWDALLYLVIAIVLIYLYVALYQVYKQSWLKTLFKFFALTASYFLLMIPLFFIFLILFSVVF